MDSIVIGNCARIPLDKLNDNIVYQLLQRAGIRFILLLASDDKLGPVYIPDSENLNSRLAAAGRAEDPQSRLTLDVFRSADNRSFLRRLSEVLRHENDEANIEREMRKLLVVLRREHTNTIAQIKRKTNLSFWSLDDITENSVRNLCL
jgi:hypothetical protein